MITHFLRIPGQLRLPLSLLGFLLGLWPLQPAVAAEGQPMVRVVCPVPVEGQTGCVLASRDKTGEWAEISRLELRPTFISEWLKVPAGELAVCVPEGGKLVSKGSFTLPEASVRSLVVLLPGAEKDQYAPRVVDAGKQAFGKGTTLVVNSGSMVCTVKLGGADMEFKPGESRVVEPDLDDKGMYQMLVSHAGEDGKSVACFDRYVSANKSARDLVFLIPDPASGIKVVSMSDFGPFE